MQTFTCSRCEEEFTQGWSDGEALDECELLWGERDPDKLAELCEDCFRDFLAWKGMLGHA